MTGVSFTKRRKRACKEETSQGFTISKKDKMPQIINAVFGFLWLRKGEKKVGAKRSVVYCGRSPSIGLQ